MKYFTLCRKHLIATGFFCAALLALPLAAPAAPVPAKTVPQIAAEMGAELNEQLSQNAGRVSIIVTTPVNLRLPYSVHLNATLHRCAKCFSVFAHLMARCKR